MWGALFKLIPSVLPGVFRAIRRRQERVALRSKIEAHTDATLELKASEIRMLQAEGAKSSLKDEWWVLCLSLPWLAMFGSVWAPELSDAAERMVRLVGEDAYRYFLGSAIAASFGIRVWKR